MVDTDRITGAAKAFGGTEQGAAGEPTGSKRDSVEGRARAAQGAAGTLYGQAEDAEHDAGRDAARDLARRGGRDVR